MAPDRWQMSQKDGKSVLLDAKEKKGVFTIRVADHELEANKKAAMGCPVNIIKVKKG
jgi:ferredoxin